MFLQVVPELGILRHDFSDLEFGFGYYITRDFRYSSPILVTSASPLGIGVELLTMSDQRVYDQVGMSWGQDATKDTESSEAMQKESELLGLSLIRSTKSVPDLHRLLKGPCV